MTDKTYLIVGGNSGIGRATLERLQAQGDTVICACRQPDDLADAGVATLPFEATHSDPPDWQLPETLDGLVYCPGTINLKSFRALKDADYEADFAVNVMGAVRAIRAALPALKRAEQASIVLFSTVAVQTGLPFHASVAVAKGAVEGLARSLAAELAPGIRVNAVAPGLTDTPLASGLLDSDKKREAAAGRSPLRQVGDPSDTAALVAFLLGDQARFMTGQVIGVDGGLSALRPL